MIKIGIIGYGSMGSMITNSILTKNFIKPDEIIISTRSINKLNSLKQKWNKINIADNKTVAQNAKYIFICVKPLEVCQVLEEIKKFLTEDKHLISIAGCITLNNLESIFDGQITKVIPSITSVVFEGITLVCHNNKVNLENKKFVEDLFNNISTVKIIKEKDFEVGSDLTSCAPGMIAAIFQNFLNAGLRHSSINENDAFKMVIKTLYGTAKLLDETKMNFNEVISRVATKGGITEEGVKVLNNYLPEVFNEVFKSTLIKHEIRKQKINEIFKNALSR